MFLCNFERTTSMHGRNRNTIDTIHFAYTWFAVSTPATAPPTPNLNRIQFPCPGWNRWNHFIFGWGHAMTDAASSIGYVRAHWNAAQNNCIICLSEWCATAYESKSTAQRPISIHHFILFFSFHFPIELGMWLIEFAQLGNTHNSRLSGVLYSASHFMGLVRLEFVVDDCVLSSW